MAVLSSLLFSKSSGLAPSQFGAATTSALQLTSNLALETEIAKWGATQVLLPTRLGEFGSMNTPKEVIDKLRQLWSAGEHPTILVNRQDILDGHSLVPYQIVDKGSNAIAVMVYDPDYPMQERELAVDLNTERWSYQLSVSSSGVPYTFEGDATNYNLHLISPSGRLLKQDGPFCGSAGTNQSSTQSNNEVTLDGKPNAGLFVGDVKMIMAATDSSYTSIQGAVGTKGNEAGHLVGNGFKQVMVDLTLLSPRLLNGPGPSPLINIPGGNDSTITLSDSDATKDMPTAFTLTGAGYDLVVEDIVLHPGQEDTIVIPKGQGQITYSTTAVETPIVSAGFANATADFELSIVASGSPTGVSVTLKKDELKGQFSFQLKSAVNYTLQLIRIDALGEQDFSHAGVANTDNDTIIIQYGTWQGQGTPLMLQIDHGSDGTIDQMLQLTDDDLPKIF